ncbi:hypothetical protein HXB02_06555 [Listeria monocytogenes]|nr:hypothetical protein [Listeria monocytogenes]
MTTQPHWYANFRGIYTVEIEKWIIETDKKLAGKNLVFYYEFDNGESYSDHHTYVTGPYFKTIKQAFDYMLVNSRMKPSIIEDHENGEPTLLFEEKSAHAFTARWLATLEYMKYWAD